MDKLYKPLFLQAVKQRMRAALPDFSPVKVTRGQAMAELFSGCLLYGSASQPGHTAWLCWQPDAGLERRFFVRVGWSPSRDVLPAHPVHDARIHALRGPSLEYPACSLPLEQVLGPSAIGGFDIPSPWDQVYQLKPATPAVEQRRVMQKAAAEANALTPEQRLSAVVAVVDEVFAQLLPVLPAFTAPVGIR